MILHAAVAQLGVTFVNAINVKNNAKNNKWYFLQTIVSFLLIKLLKRDRVLCWKVYRVLYD